MISRLTETNECETAAGRPGRAVIVLLILAALLVVATSVVIAVRGNEFVNPGASLSALAPVVTATFAGMMPHPRVR